MICIMCGEGMNLCGWYCGDSEERGDLRRKGRWVHVWEKMCQFVTGCCRTTGGVLNRMKDKL